MRKLDCQFMAFLLVWTSSRSRITSSAPMMLFCADAFVSRSSSVRNNLKMGLNRRYVASSSESVASGEESSKLINLHTIPKEELETIIESWNYPKYRAQQIHTHIRQGITSVDDMSNLPEQLRQELKQFSCIGSLTLDTELISAKDGTKKRAYRLHDGQLIESVLMPYKDGRYTACISSQAGCAMGCQFCATGQMGFARQLSSDEIFEQVSRFAAELRADNQKRLSNVVFMGMGEPLANYRNVIKAVNRITSELGIGARKITISTVGVVPNIRKLIHDPNVPQVRLAVSLHCASDEERSALLPANARYGGLHELMTTLQEYITTSGRRLTFEWALIEGQNDHPVNAHQLGKLLTRDYQLRRDMMHINVIPLNPTGGYAGSPSGRSRVNQFIQILEKDYSISTTPRVRRGIDIAAGCGQLTSSIEKKNQEKDSSVKKELQSFIESAVPPVVDVYDKDDRVDESSQSSNSSPSSREVVDFSVDTAAVDFESEEWQDPEFDSEWEQQEAARLISLVQDSVIPTSSLDSKKTTSITNTDALVDAKRRRRKILKNLKAIQKLRERSASGWTLNEEQLTKIAREDEWKSELESVQHNLQ